jgi:rfaE bifunctional protein kinase chain/domain
VSPQAPVVVIGDVMLDVFEEGVVERISPEAPVAVLRNPTGFEVLGGAANAALNIDALGIAAALMGLVGGDDAGRRCGELVRISGIGESLLNVADWPTLVKHRFLASGQQMLRVDIEHPLPDGAAASLLPLLAARIEGASAVVLSDYDKGTVSDAMAGEAVRLSSEVGVPVVVDSKRLDPRPFLGCTIIAPNHLEATRMTGTQDPQLAAERIAEATRSAVLVTLGADGMLLYHDGRVDRIHSEAREVADVTGAGDSVTAGLAVALVGGASLVEAARFAATVAAVAVAHRGTYAVTRADLHLDDEQ